jgi:hypothetical protein
VIGRTMMIARSLDHEVAWAGCANSRGRTRFER